MPNVIAELTQVYEDVWSLDDYGNYSPGAEAIDFFKTMTDAKSGASVLDAGCGSGKGGLRLAAAGYNVLLCDMTAAGLTDGAKTLPFATAILWHDLSGLYQAHRPPGLWRPAAKFDYVYCCDVMEHLPTEWTMLALSRMLAVCYEGLFLSIALRPDHYGAMVGTPLHLTVRPFTWWRDNLKELGELVEARDRVNDGLFFVRPHV